MQSQRIQPAPGQESVWDYPRPPRVEPTSQHVRVVFNGVTIADTHRAQRVLETSHPPTYYIPLEDVKTEYLFPASRTSFCEWKGKAKYYTIKVGDKEAANAAWQYPQANERHASIRDCIAVYPSQMDACYVGDERVQPQAGDFYGGWITSDIVGPFKGGPGTYRW